MRKCEVIELYHIAINCPGDKAESENVDQVLKSLRKKEECLGSSINDCTTKQKAKVVNRS